MRKDENYITDFGANVQYPPFRAGMWTHSRSLNVADVDAVFTCVSGVIADRYTANHRAGMRLVVSNAGGHSRCIYRNCGDSRGEQLRWRHTESGNGVGLKRAV